MSFAESFAGRLELPTVLRARPTVEYLLAAITLGCNDFWGVTPTTPGSSGYVARGLFWELHWITTRAYRLTNFPAS